MAYNTAAFVIFALVGFAVGLDHGNDNGLPWWPTQTSGNSLDHSNNINVKAEGLQKDAAADFDSEGFYFSQWPQLPDGEFVCQKCQFG
jgi:hypothetical protein